MKKVSLIIIICIYSLATLGIGVKQFYCCGKLKSTNIAFTQGTNQHCNNSDEMPGCCKTSFKNFKVKDCHFAADTLIVPSNSYTDLHLLYTLGTFEKPFNNSKSILNLSNAPPLHYGLPVYLLHCVYWNWV